MKKIAVLQSNYIPWKGYFDLMAFVDEFIIFDDMQFTRRDWRNRNKIKTPHGPQWMSIPVRVSGKFDQTIRETEVADPDWGMAHWTRIARNYRRARFFDEVASIFEPLFTKPPSVRLSEINRRFIEAIRQYLGIETELRNSWHYAVPDGKNERLISLCRQADAQVYVSGPSAKGYLDEQAFLDQGLSVHWFDYTGYPEYTQLWGEFAHGVTILDLLFNCGKDSRGYMKNVRL